MSYQSSNDFIDVTYVLKRPVDDEVLRRWTNRPCTTNFENWKNFTQEQLKENPKYPFAALGYNCHSFSKCFVNYILGEVPGDFPDTERQLVSQTGKTFKEAAQATGICTGLIGAASISYWIVGAVTGGTAVAAPFILAPIAIVEGL